MGILQPGVPGSATPVASAPPNLLAQLRAAQRDDDASPAALEDLMTALYPLIRRFLAARLRSWRDAKDVTDEVTQETVVRLFLHFRSCRADHDHSVIAWALTTARRTLIDLMRAPGARLLAHQFGAELVDDLEAAAARSHRPDTRTSALACSLEEAIGRREVGAPARELLLKLAVDAYTEAATETGELLWWRLIIGAEWSDVAARLDTTAAGAKRRFQRAQASLERALLSRIAALPPETRLPVQALVERYLATETEPNLPRVADPAAGQTVESDSCDDVGEGAPPSTEPWHHVQGGRVAATPNRRRARQHFPMLHDLARLHPRLAARVLAKCRVAPECVGPMELRQGSSTDGVGLLLVS